MRKLLTILAALILALAPVFSQYAAIADSAFLEALIREGVDVNLDGRISVAEAETVLHLDIQFMGISDLTGIESFTGLKSLDCSYNQLRKIDLSGNEKLEQLTCKACELRDIRLSGCPDLEYLDLYFNELTGIDLSGNGRLREINLSFNLFFSLDLSANVLLEEVYLERMPTLVEVCVWQHPLPPGEVQVHLYHSPMVMFTSDCGTLNIAPNSFGEMADVLFADRPVTGDSLRRKKALCMMDEYMLQHQNQPEVPQGFYNRMFRKAMMEIRLERVSEGLTVWQGYSMGYVVKTPSAIFGFDLVNNFNQDHVAKLADMLDAYFISHIHGDHTSDILQSAMQKRGKPVVVPSEWGTFTGMEEGEIRTFSGHQVTAHWGRHSVPSRQYELLCPDGTRLLHTGDNQTSDALPWSPGLNVLLLNAWVNESGRHDARTGVRLCLYKLQPDICLLGHFQKMDMGHNPDISFSQIFDWELPGFQLLNWGERIHYDHEKDDTIRPNPVLNLRGRISQDSIFIQWDAPEPAGDGNRASFYRVMLDRGREIFTEERELGIGWDSIRSYRFKVYAYDHCGNQSTAFTALELAIPTDENHPPRILEKYPKGGDTLDLYPGVYRRYMTQVWDPDEDELEFSWSLDQESVEATDSSAWHLDVAGMEPGIHHIHCEVTDRHDFSEASWIIRVHRDSAIIDNEDELMYSDHGQWKSLWDSTSHRGSFRTSLVDQAGDWAEFRYFPDSTAYYDLFAVIHYRDYALNRAIYTIKADGLLMDSLQVNQNLSRGDWLKIGSYYLEAGTEVAVRVINDGSSSTGLMLIADAMKFQYAQHTGSGKRSETLILYPNPFSDQVFIRQPPDDPIRKIEMTDLSGRTVRVLYPANENPVVIPREGLDAGIYFIRIHAAELHCRKVLIL